MKKSAYAFFMRIFIFLTVSLSFFTIAYGSNTIHTEYQRYAQMIQSEVQTQQKSMENDLADIYSFCRTSLYNDPDLELFSLENLPDSKRVISEFNIRRIVMSRAPDYGAIILYHSVRDKALYSFGNAVELAPLDKMDYISHILAQIADLGYRSSGIWLLDQYEGKYYLYSFQMLRSLCLCAVVDISAYMEVNRLGHVQDFGAWHLFSGGTLLSALGSGTQLSDDIRADAEAKLTRQGSNYICALDIHTTPITTAIVTPRETFYQLLLPQLIFFFVFWILSIVVLVLCFRLLRKALLFPLNEIATLSRDMAMPQKESAAGAETLYTEFKQIREGIQMLLEQKVALERERQSQEYAEQHALLQYYQLQTRSHFFLNFLKSLYNMAEQYNAGKMQMMIGAFSAHLRFVFHDTLSMVRLKAELQEVSDYHRIISQDLARPFILSVDCPPALEDCQVPPLIIQTFLENTYKHNGANSSPLLFKVGISSVELEDHAAFLRIHISDNGSGYSQEAVNALNAPPKGNFDQYHVGINNLRRRMEILYKDRFEIGFYNGPAGGAISVIYIPIS